MFTLAELQAAAKTVYGSIPPTPQIAWPLLSAKAGCEVWVKHENHTPTGAFKVRGGLVYVDRLIRERPRIHGLISATRGNHGQSLPFAARRHAHLDVTIVVPEGNSGEKNAAMEAFGAKLIHHGRDFVAAVDEARRIAEATGAELVQVFHRDLVTGVATYAQELFTAVADLDAVYVPIGGGSGICGLIRTRDLLGLKTKIVGVVSEHADAYAVSFETGVLTETDAALTFADGMAVRRPVPEALEIIRAGADHVVRVSDDEVAEAIRTLYESTHNLAEGAGAAPFAAIMQERASLKGKRVAMVLSGQNIDRRVMVDILRGSTPRVDASGHVVTTALPMESCGATP